MFNFLRPDSLGDPADAGQPHKTHCLMLFDPPVRNL